MTEQEKSRFPNERPLYLYIQGHSQQNIDCECSLFIRVRMSWFKINLKKFVTFIVSVAVQKIDEIIKTEHRSSLNRPSRFTNAPPPLMSLQPVGPSVVIL